MRSMRRYNVALAIASGLVITASAGTVAGAALKTGAIYPLKATAVFAALLVAVVLVTGDEPQHLRLAPANYVTAIRAILVALVAGVVGHPVTSEVLWSVVGLTALIGGLDGLDGWLARRTRLASAFGARFDMETDALLILVLSILVWQHEKAGAWVLLCGLMRYGFVAAGCLLPWLARPLRSTWRAKVVAVGQLIGLSVALTPIVPAPPSAIVATSALAALAWSFSVDVMWLWSQSRAT